MWFARSYCNSHISQQNHFSRLETLKQEELLAFNCVWSQPVWCTASLVRACVCVFACASLWMAEQTMRCRSQGRCPSWPLMESEWAAACVVELLCVGGIAWSLLTQNLSEHCSRTPNRDSRLRAVDRGGRAVGVYWPSHMPASPHAAPQAAAEHSLLAAAHLPAPGLTAGTLNHA